MDVTRTENEPGIVVIAEHRDRLIQKNFYKHLG